MQQMLLGFPPFFGPIWRLDMYPPFRGTYRILVHGGLRSDGGVGEDLRIKHFPNPQIPKSPTMSQTSTPPPTARLPRAPSAPGTANLHTWSLRPIMPTVWVACSRA